MKKKLASLLLAGMLFVGASGIVSARHVAGYKFNLPRFGSPVYTDSLKKTNSTRAVNNNNYVGGNYNLFCRVVRNGQNLTNEVKQRSGERRLLNYTAPWNEVGKRVSLKLYSHWTDYVRIHVSGTWSPDER